MRNKIVMWALFSAIAVFLATSLLRNEAYAQPNLEPVTLVGIAAYEYNGTRYLNRAWSDGLVEEARFNTFCDGWCDWVVVPN